MHPYNLGWGALVLVISDDEGLNFLRKSNEKFTEINVVDYVLEYMRYWENPQEWLEEILNQYKKENKNISPPQLSVASWLVAGICTHIAFDIATNKPIKVFPEFYLTTIK